MKHLHKKKTGFFLYFAELCTSIISNSSNDVHTQGNTYFLIKWNNIYHNVNETLHYLTTWPHLWRIVSVLLGRILFYWRHDPELRMSFVLFSLRDLSQKKLYTVHLNKSLLTLSKLLMCSSMLRSMNPFILRMCWTIFLRDGLGT